MVESDVLQNDLRDMLRALGMGDHARPQSPHEVFRECIERVERMRAALKAVKKEFDTGRVNPKLGEIVMAALGYQQNGERRDG